MKAPLPATTSRESIIADAHHREELQNLWKAIDTACADVENIRKRLTSLRLDYDVMLKKHDAVIKENERLKAENDALRAELALLRGAG